VAKGCVQSGAQPLCLKDIGVLAQLLPLIKHLIKPWAITLFTVAQHLDTWWQVWINRRWWCAGRSLQPCTGKQNAGSALTKWKETSSI